MKKLIYSFMIIMLVIGCSPNDNDEELSNEMTSINDQEVEEANDQVKETEVSNNDLINNEDNTETKKKSNDNTESNNNDSISVTHSSDSTATSKKTATKSTENNHSSQKKTNTTKTNTTKTNTSKETTTSNQDNQTKTETNTTKTEVKEETPEEFTMTKNEIIEYGKSYILSKGYDYDTSGSGWSMIDVHKGESESQIKTELKGLINVLMDESSSDQGGMGIKVVNYEDYWKVRVIF